MTKKNQGLGSDKLSPEKRRQIASMGGKAAHKSGNAHQFTSEEARIAGKKGGLARTKNAKEREKNV